MNRKFSMGLGAFALSLMLAQGVAFAASTPGYPDTAFIANPTSAECKGNRKLLTTNKINLSRNAAKLKKENDSLASLTKQVNAKRKAFKKKFQELRNRILVAGTDMAGQLGIDFVDEAIDTYTADANNLSGEKIPSINFVDPTGVKNVFKPELPDYAHNDDSKDLPDTFKTGLANLRQASIVTLVFQAFKTYKGVPGSFYDVALTSSTINGKFDISVFLDVFFKIPLATDTGYTSEERERAIERAKADREKRVAELNQQGVRLYNLIVDRDTLIKNFNNSALSLRLARSQKAVNTLSEEKTRLGRQKENLSITKRNCNSAS